MKGNSDILRKLRTIVGPGNMLVDREKMVDYSHDEFAVGDIASFPDVVVKPDSTKTISSIMKLAQSYGVPVTPRGGATGLAGGCVPVSGGILLSLERMNKIIEIDIHNQMAVVEAGVTLTDFYQAVEDRGLFFPPHPGEESAMIGGVIATNAGGARAVKYGVIRNYVRGLEVVLPSGAVINLGGKLMKTSTGYSLLHLMIGSEGTLGIITKAVIQIMPAPQVSRSLIIPYDSLEPAIDSVPQLIENKILPLAVEFIPRDVIDITEEFLKKRWPVREGNMFLLIILDASGEEDMDRLSEIVADICLAGGARDVFVADNPQKQAQVLEIRSKIYEAIKADTLEVLDIVVPRGEIASHVKKVEEISLKYGVWLPTFGHAADGNVHTHIMKVRLEDGRRIPLKEKEWKENMQKVREELYRDCRFRKGMISGEHGIGLIKKPYLPIVLDPSQIEIMRGIKRVFDPSNILNPGKIFDMEENSR